MVCQSSFTESLHSRQTFPTHIELTVRDNGPGITPTNLRRIFTPFFSTKAGQGSRGLGLALVRLIVARHQGTIEVESEPGSGTTFRIYLPLHSC